MAELGSAFTVAEDDKALATGGDVRMYVATSAVRAHGGP
jgi:hypothetical protein